MQPICPILVIRRLGFKPFDALHITGAIAGGAGVMLITGDHLLRRAAQYRSSVKRLS